MWRSGRTLSLALAALACAAATAVAGCGSDEDEPPGSTPGSVVPIGELAGPTIPLDESGFDPLLALTVEATGEGRTLIAGEVRLSRPQGSGAGVAEVRIAIDGDRSREAEARMIGDDRLVVACGCELEPGEHEVELQGRSVGGVSPVAARSLVALDGVEYETDTPSRLGPAASGDQRLGARDRPGAGLGGAHVGRPARARRRLVELREPPRHRRGRLDAVLGGSQGDRATGDRRRRGSDANRVPRGRRVEDRGLHARDRPEPRARPWT